MYKAYITKIKNLRKHSNADRLQVGECFGNKVIVSLDIEEDQLGVYFAVDGQLSEEFAVANNLLRKKDDAGNEVGGFLNPVKRNIAALRLRGEKSDGLFLPMSSLNAFKGKIELKDGDSFDILNGKLICSKYIPEIKNPRNTGMQNKNKKVTKKEVLFPDFKEHKDTEQLAYNINDINVGDTLYITLKMHGTSQRTGFLPKTIKKNWFERLFKINKKPVYEIVTGTRRVVLNAFNNKTSFYGSDLFRKKYHELLSTKLNKGETAYYEVVGYTENGNLIMPEVDNSKTKDKDFVKQYGKTTKFEYGCEIGQSEMFLYRMTYTTQDGMVIEYPTEKVKMRASEMGVNFVPIFDKFIFTTKEDLMERVERFEDGVDPIGKTHIREGIVVRVDNSNTFKAYKHKNFNFKVIEGIAKVDAVAPDMEEVQQGE